MSEVEGFGRISSHLWLWALHYIHFENLPSLPRFKGNPGDSCRDGASSKSWIRPRIHVSGCDRLCVLVHNRKPKAMSMLFLWQFLEKSNINCGLLTSKMLIHHQLIQIFTGKKIPFYQKRSLTVPLYFLSLIGGSSSLNSRRCFGWAEKDPRELEAVSCCWHKKKIACQPAYIPSTFKQTGLM